MATVLVVGGGGREHAICISLAESAKVSSILVCPGNAGTALLNKTENINVDVKKHDVVIETCQRSKVDLVIIGPEQPLADGLADALHKRGLQVFGPSSQAARIETSKCWAKEFMERNGVPTAATKSFNNLGQIEEFLKKRPWTRFAVKCSGLAGGKGVLVTDCEEAALKFITEMNKKSGDLTEYIIEEALEGHEVSLLAFTDGKNVALMPPAQDYKRRFEFGKGPNTGGMGAICPTPFVNDELIIKMKEEIVLPTIRGMEKEGYPFKGVLYAGVILTSSGPKVLEFNCRFGDPETQVILPLLKTDLFDIVQSCSNGTLNKMSVQFESSLFSVAVCVVVKNYPACVSDGMGKTIKGLDMVSNSSIKVVHAGTKLCDNVVTSGGRVLAVCAIGNSFQIARSRALERSAQISFEVDEEKYGASFREDIALDAALGSLWKKNKELTYKSSGVDIQKGNEFVEIIRHFAAKSFRQGVKGELGLFGSVFDMAQEGYKEAPYIIAGTDGVGTKLKIAQQMKKHNTIGQDLVAMCVNDILMQAAEPLFFLDYFATGKLEVNVAAKVVIGIAAACREAKCSLVGGETAEMSGFYPLGCYDLAGFAVGAVSKDDLLPKSELMEAGDVIIGVTSSGIHSNGFSLVRKFLEGMDFSYEDPAPFDSTKTLGDYLIEPTVLYTPLLKLLRTKTTVGAAHITGGGIRENLARILPTTLVANVTNCGQIPNIFLWLAGNGITPIEMWKTFNLGIGVALVVKQEAQESTLAYIDQHMKGNVKGIVMGTLIERSKDILMAAVEFSQLETILLEQVVQMNLAHPMAFPLRVKKRVAVLISGSGTNLQALMNHSISGVSLAEIVLVISNVDGVQGLKRAQQSGIPTKVIPHKNYPCRKAFEEAIQEELTLVGIEYVCLAGFMRILTGTFVGKWRGRLLNIHPSLLPSFKGIDAQKQALAAGVSITGCSVHFVEEEVDAGAIITQEAVQVFDGDTVDILSERIKTAEHIAFPRALEMVVRHRVYLDQDGKIGK